MLDLDAIEARAEAELSYAWEERVEALVAELRAAREVVEAVDKWKIALTWDAEWSIRPAEVGSTLQRKSELLEPLAAYGAVKLPSSAPASSSPPETDSEYQDFLNRLRQSQLKRGIKQGIPPASSSPHGMVSVSQDSLNQPYEQQTPMPRT